MLGYSITSPPLALKEAPFEPSSHFDQCKQTILVACNSRKRNVTTSLS